MNIARTILGATSLVLLTVGATLFVTEPYTFSKGHAAAMAEVDAMVQPVGWETIRKTKEACEAKWKTECVITGGYMPKMDVQP